MYSVEYSASTKCFHIDELKHTLKLNYNNFLEDFGNDWQIIKIFKTMQEAEDFCKKFSEETRRRQIEKRNGN